MDVAVDLYVAVPLLFTVLAVILASVFVKLRSSKEDKATEPAAKEEREAKASVAEVDPTDGETLPKDEREPEAAGTEPRKEKGEEEEAVIKSRGAGGVAVEEIGAEEEGTNEGKEEGLREKKGKEEDEDEAAPEAVKAEQRSHVQVERKVPGQAERGEVVAAPVALEEPEEDEEEEEEEEDEEEDEESKEEDQESENEKLAVKEPETEDADEKFSLKYSPGKLRGNQYKTMMTKEELEEEQRTEDYMKLSLDSS